MLSGYRLYQIHASFVIRYFFFQAGNIKTLFRCIFFKLRILLNGIFAGFFFWTSDVIVPYLYIEVIVEFFGLSCTFSLDSSFFFLTLNWKMLSAVSFLKYFTAERIRLLRIKY